MPNYSLVELHNRFLEDRKFDRIYKEWIRSGYDKQFKPSLDRIDCMKPYTLKNLHILSWAENRYKQRMEFKRIRARTVLMKKGDEIIRKFKSVSHAVRETGLHQGNISSCLHNKRITVGGYKFIYENPSQSE